MSRNEIPVQNKPVSISEMPNNLGMVNKSSQLGVLEEPRILEKSLRIQGFVGASKVKFYISLFLLDK